MHHQVSSWLYLSFLNPETGKRNSWFLKFRKFKQKCTSRNSLFLYLLSLYRLYPKIAPNMTRAMSTIPTVPTENPVLWYWDYFKFGTDFKLSINDFLAPTGAQVVTLSVCLYVCAGQVCLEQSSFYVREHSESNQRAISRALKSESYSRSLKYCVLLHKLFTKLLLNSTVWHSRIAL